MRIFDDELPVYFNYFSGMLQKMHVRIVSIGLRLSMMLNP